MYLLWPLVDAAPTIQAHPIHYTRSFSGFKVIHTNQDHPKDSGQPHYAAVTVGRMGSSIL